MAITVIQPNSLCFAGNPIIVKATTDKYLSEDESMLRVILEATFTEKYEGGEARDAYSFSTELSQPVENGGTAVFNLSDASRTILQRLVSEMNMNGVWYKSVGLHCEFSCRDVWVKDGYEQFGDSSGVFSFEVIPGFFTDYEMLTRSSTDLHDVMPVMLSRMPSDGRILYKGEELIIPTLVGEESAADGKVEVSGEYFDFSGALMKAGEVNYQRGVVSSEEDGVFTFSSTYTDSVSGYYRASAEGVHFLRFINGFGAVENISVRSRDKLSYGISGENHSLVQGISVRPTDRRYSVKSQPVGVYELSSGYVPKRWAEWYIQELLVSPRVWILLEGKWVPALIEASDECVIYDRSNPEMPHVDFTLRLAIDGVTGCVW